MSGRCTPTTAALVGALLVLGAARPAAADDAIAGPAAPREPGATTEVAGVSYEKAIEIPALAAEEIRIVNRLGSVSVVGWDRPAVGVSATKQAPSAELGERLRVQVASRTGREIEVWTYVRMRPAIPAPMSRALRRLMRRQARVLEALASRRVDQRAARKQLQAIQQRADELARRYGEGGALASEPSDLDVPVLDGRLDLRVHVPRGLRVSARTFKDRLAVVGCSGGLDLSTEEGTLSAERVAGRIVTWNQRGAQRLIEVKGSVEVGGGESDVALRDVIGPVRVTVVSGSIDARSLGARVATLRMVHGKIMVDGVPRGGRYLVVTHDGDLVVSAVPGRAFRLEAQAPRVEQEGVELAGSRRDGDTFVGTWGRRGGLLRLSTRRGALRLSR